MNRDNRKNLAEQTLQIIEQGEYVTENGTCVHIADAIKACVEETQLLTPDTLRALLDSPVLSRNEVTTIEVNNETTLQAARRLATANTSERVLCLNFASAKNPGGGFLGGAQAQEESLARSSALYATLLAAPEYYEINRSCGTCFYTDHMILSPGVPVFRDDTGDLLGEPYNIDFLTAPAVNAGAIADNEPRKVDQIPSVMRRRIEALLALATTRGYRYLVLGAWGCGVFRNDPALVAGLFAEHLATGGQYSQCFNHVVFAVLDKPEGTVHRAFYDMFMQEKEGAEP